MNGFRQRVPGKIEDLGNVHRAAQHFGFGAVKLQYLAQQGFELRTGIQVRDRRAEPRRHFPLREQTSGQREQPLDPAPAERFDIAVFDVDVDGKHGGLLQKLLIDLARLLQ
jgi:hypothetical protein